VNILPSYKCNLACPFCAIHQLDRGELLDLDWLEQTIKDLPQGQIDILGGEPSLLSDEYAKKLICICKEHAGDARVGMYTNLIKISPLIHDVSLTVSYDPGSRQLSDKVRSNMLLLDVPFEINMIVTKHVVARGAQWILNLAKRLKRLTKITLSTLNVFPGCPDLRPDPLELAQFCQDIIRLDKEQKIYFYPISTWTIDYIKTPDPEQIVEILPNKKFRISLRDYFGHKEFDTFEEAAGYYNQNCEDSEPLCSKCPYFRRCTHMFTDGKTYCHDRIITESILIALSEKKTHEYLPKL